MPELNRLYRDYQDRVQFFVVYIEEAHPIDAWQVSGDARYLAAAEKTWAFIEAYLVDPKHGEWFRGVTRDGHVIATFEKAGFWKCPYHNGRMGLEAIARLRSK